MIVRKYITIILLFFSVIVQAEQSKNFTSLGAFSNFRFTTEHQYGSGIQLWQKGESLFGLFSYSQGLIGDTPTGEIENASFNPKTGHIVFIARLTTGQHFCNVHKKGVHSQDIFTFNGVLSSTSLVGTLNYTDNLHQDRAPIPQKIILKKTKDWFNIQFKDRDQWNIVVKKILKYRGPKW